MNKTLFFLLCLAFFSCKQEQPNAVMPVNKVTGKTMGTTYMVTYSDEEQSGLKEKIDSLLVEVNESVSTYIPTSIISQVNQAEEGKIKIDLHFARNFSSSKLIHESTQGYFNPAIMPLVNYYGFGFEKLKERRTIDTLEVKKLHGLCNFENFKLIDNHVTKTMSGSQLDFSAIAKGYGVDQVAELMIENGIHNFLVEIGGEGYAQGKNERGVAWKFGVRTPSQKDRKAYLKAIPVHKKAIATSGNYENYRELENKQVIGHTIDPKTGFAQSLSEDLLSVTVIADNCMTADAYATAFKAMGFNRSLDALKTINNVQVFFVYRNDEGGIGTYSTLSNDGQ